MLTSVAGRRIAVFCLAAGELLAYENLCPHLGGPVCEGEIRPAVTAVVDEDGRLLDECSDMGSPRLICPWHGWEFDLATGQAIGDPLRRLCRLDLVLEGEDVFVLLA